MKNNENDKSKLLNNKMPAIVKNILYDVGMLVSNTLNKVSDLFRHVDENNAPSSQTLNQQSFLNIEAKANVSLSDHEKLDKTVLFNNPDSLNNAVLSEQVTPISTSSGQRRSLSLAITPVNTDVPKFPEKLENQSAPITFSTSSGQRRSLSLAITPVNTDVPKTAEKLENQSAPITSSTSSGQRRSLSLAITPVNTDVPKAPEKLENQLAPITFSTTSSGQRRSLSLAITPVNTDVPKTAEKLENIVAGYNDIPDEIWKDIIHYLDSEQDFLNFSGTCKKLQFLFNTDSKLRTIKNSLIRNGIPFGLDFMKALDDTRLKSLGKGLTEKECVALGALLGIYWTETSIKKVLSSVHLMEILPKSPIDIRISFKDHSKGKLFYELLEKNNLSPTWKYTSETYIVISRKKTNELAARLENGEKLITIKQPLPNKALWGSYSEKDVIKINHNFTQATKIISEIQYYSFNAINRKDPISFKMLGINQLGIAFYAHNNVHNQLVLGLKPEEGSKSRFENGFDGSVSLILSEHYGKWSGKEKWPLDSHESTTALLNMNLLTLAENLAEQKLAIERELKEPAKAKKISP